MIIGHWPPILRRVTPTISWTSPATTAQAPHTRRTAGMPDAPATARPTAASRLTATLTYSQGRRAGGARDAGVDDRGGHVDQRIEHEQRDGERVEVPRRS